MIVAKKIKDGRKNHRSRKNHKTKVKFQKDGIYKSIGLTMWARYLDWEFRIAEIYYFLGLRESIVNYNEEDLEFLFIDFTEICNRIISKVNTDFIEVLKSAQDYYQDREKYFEFYDWFCDDE